MNFAFEWPVELLVLLPVWRQSYCIVWMDISHYKILYKFQEINTETGEGKELLFEPLPCVRASMCFLIQFSPSKGSEIYIKIGGGWSPERWVWKHSLRVKLRCRLSWSKILSTPSLVLGKKVLECFYCLGRELTKMGRIREEIKRRVQKQFTIFIRITNKNIVLFIDGLKPVDTCKWLFPVVNALLRLKVILESCLIIKLLSDGGQEQFTQIFPLSSFPGQPQEEKVILTNVFHIGCLLKRFQWRPEESDRNCMCHGETLPISCQDLSDSWTTWNRKIKNHCWHPVPPADRGKVFVRAAAFLIEYIISHH